MALLTGVLVSVTELIKMHMFGIIQRLSLAGRADLCKLSGSASDAETRVKQGNCFLAFFFLARNTTKMSRDQADLSKTAVF